MAQDILVRKIKMMDGVIAFTFHFRFLVSVPPLPGSLKELHPFSNLLVKIQRSPPIGIEGTVEERHMYVASGIPDNVAWCL